MLPTYQAADMFAVYDEKLFSGMCKWSNHCLHHLLPSKRDIGHNLRHIGNSYQLVSYNYSSTRRCFIVLCCLIHCKHLRLSDVNKYTYLLTYLDKTKKREKRTQNVAVRHFYALSRQKVLF